GGKGRAGESMGVGGRGSGAGGFQRCLESLGPFHLIRFQIATGLCELRGNEELGMQEILNVGMLDFPIPWPLIPGPSRPRMDLHLKLRRHGRARTYCR
ncbi:MAG: hypothetical protein KDA80_23325, partial [Planctomycetaceae bacterium]|nr:hypothetical protein [Planctomycetaceae bacterium]